MSYRIEYDSRINKYEVKQEKNLFPMFLVLSFMVISLIFCIQPGMLDAVRSFLIPGEDTVTMQAFSAMSDDLRSGAGLWEAVEVFCRGVIHGQ